jgi:HK97 family phage prohead protease
MATTMPVMTTMMPVMTAMGQMGTTEMPVNRLNSMDEIIKAIRRLAGDDADTSYWEHLAKEQTKPFDGVVQEVFVEDKAIRVEAREVDFTASTADMDAHGDIVEQEFLFERFLRNPVILFAHNSTALPIGQAANVRVEGGALRLTVKFASKQANPLAEQVFLLIKERVLRAMSIGFVPHDIRREMRDEKEVWILSKNELIESSVVPIPANPNALVDAKAKALGTKTQTALSPPWAQEQPADGGEETDMSEMLNKQIAELTKARDTAAAELDALKARYSALEELYKEEKGRANDAQAAVVARDLDELIGKKISPKEKASLLKLAAVNRELYEEQMAAIKDRPDMNLCESSVLPVELPQPRALPSPDHKAGDDFASLVLRRAGMNS